ncbi:TonB-dependent receptor [Novosphingobium sp. SG720]|uniref:TonB-dependent receptor n=1 Tax=Novosphingobium sp. SG720 TaxID=2586998 RepID=UPI001447043A|nr:TonB-dependent receptor [Novosphingobium sp. SG720]NKJ44053.1 iron complex outermembrane receptor protein [Novosphingobium sp. SG720]
MRLSHSAFLATASAPAAMLAAALATPALAQEAPQSGAVPADDSGIIVTARRQNERLQDVPASVAVLTADALQRTGAVKAEDFVKLTPGVTIVTGTAEAGDTQINIRGMNGARDAESSVALVVDGILKTNTAQLNQPQGTLQQVELLKGPQGALYGRNAAAGALVLQSIKPTDSFTGAAKLSYADYNTWEASAHVAGPLAQNVGFVLAGYYYKTDGFYKNVFTNSKTVDDKENWAIDGRVMVGQGSPTQLDIKARYSEFHGASLPFNAAFHLPNFGGAFYENVNSHPFNFYSNIRPTNDQTSFDMSIKLDHQLTDTIKLVGWALYSNVNQDLVADGTSADFGRFLSAANPQAQSAVNSCFASTAALTGYKVNPPGFIGQTPVPFIFAPTTGSTFGPYSPTTCDGTQYQLRKQQDISTEWRLIGDLGQINWQLGAYYLHIKRTVGVSLGADTGNGVIKQLYNAPNTTNPTTLLLADRFKTNVYAGFGSVEWKPNEKFDAGLVLRYDIEDRKSSSLVPTATDPFTGGPINPGQAFGPLTDKHARFEQFEPKVTLSYKPSREFNLYANWGIGFKSGGFNNQGSAQIIKDNFVNAFGANVTVNDQYRKEWSSAWEAGLKGNLLNGALTFDLAGYYTQVHDMQFFEFFVGSFGLLRVVSNIDRVDLKGIEASVTVKPIKGVKLFGSFNYTDSEIKRNSSRPYTVGNKSPYTADYTLNLGGEFEQSLSGDLRLFTRADYRLTGPTWFHTVQNQSVPTVFSGLLPISALQLPAFVGDGKYDVARRNAFGIVNLRAGLQTDRYTLAVFANNLLDKQYLNEVITAVEFGGSFITPGTRRLVGVEASVKF